jgi:hypothetical protein
MLSGGQISTPLKQVLSNPRILKVGRNIDADLKNIFSKQSIPQLRLLAESILQN